jgi:hypothetical protein
MEVTAAGKPGKRQGLGKALRRLGRGALKLTCGLALLAFVAITVFAVRSYWVQDLAQVAYQWYPTPDAYRARWLAVRSLRGTVSFGIVRNDLDFRRPAHGVRDATEREWVDGFLKRNPKGFRGSYSKLPAALNQMRVNFFHPSYKHRDQSGAWRHDEYWTVTIPSAYVMLVLLVLPCLYGTRMLRRHARVRRGLCVHCGYDLRASGAICPECGSSRTLQDAARGT